MRKNKVDIITLGCSKNLVDSEHLISQFKANGYTVAHDPEKVNGEIVIVNTCGFIEAAQDESLKMIIELEDAKQHGRIGRLFVMGCLSERFMEEMKNELPGVDRFYGKFNWQNILRDLGKSYYLDLPNGRTLTTPAHYAYLKISEGCDRRCSYCAIPVMTGSHKSRPMDEIVAEARSLAVGGIKELQLIAQDLTYYGKDLYSRYALPELVERLADIERIEWIRLHYGYPAHFPYDLLRVIRERNNVCKYLDIALQHISDTVLSKMRRGITRDETYRLIERIRKEAPGIHLRTTFIVGHPGETDDDFAALTDFVREMRFERMGAFAYSHEAGTYAAEHYTDDVPLKIKQQRLDELMDIQQVISSEINVAKVGTVMKTIIDRREGDYYVGRTEYDSPEIDPEVLLKSDTQLHVGQFYDVFIERADAYELYGKTGQRKKKSVLLKKNGEKFG
ncbi:MAG: 30S ribosomal protein S12 methylthiotransferase RimO [Tannerella sp.]|jgi:ribosomal protein S12 methylthiotransferase|nr:30S ribosomal protein S12 methylthiotransferase RimO [Tannerella sp.]